mmetsp:Transcript_13114/g.31612  ORF Transcript_13114/g.31612 Transcript_13114/m.31612 type:complete len:245 (-) Transcript_13114:169-903(-)
MPGDHQSGHLLYSAKDAERASAYVSEYWVWALDYTGIQPKPKPMSNIDQVLHTIQESLSHFEPYLSPATTFVRTHLSRHGHNAAECLSVLHVQAASSLSLIKHKAADLVEDPLLLLGRQDPLHLMVLCIMAVVAFTSLWLLFRRPRASPPTPKTSPSKRPTVTAVNKRLSLSSSPRTPPRSPVQRPSPSSTKTPTRISSPKARPLSTWGPEPSSCEAVKLKAFSPVGGLSKDRHLQAVQRRIVC